MKIFLKIILMFALIGTAYSYRAELKDYAFDLGGRFGITETEKGTGAEKITPPPYVPGPTPATPKAVSTPGPLKVEKTVPTSSLDSSGKVNVAGVITLTNEERLANGLSALRANADLNRSAELKLRDMFEKQYFEHVSPSGIGIEDLARIVGYEYITIGENLALGDFGSSQELVDAWMASPGHRANVLNSRYSEIGVAVGRGNYNGSTVWLAVQHFGLPLSACPAIDPVLKERIDSNKAELESLAARLETMKKEIDAYEDKQSREYRAKVDEYNSLVGQYNALIDETKKLIAQYNDQVSVFNACIAG